MCWEEFPDCSDGVANRSVVFFRANFAALSPSVWAPARPLPDGDDHLVCQTEPPNAPTRVFLAMPIPGIVVAMATELPADRWREDRPQQRHSSLGQSPNVSSVTNRGSCDRKGKYLIGGDYG